MRSLNGPEQHIRQGYGHDDSLPFRATAFTADNLIAGLAIKAPEYFLACPITDTSASLYLFRSAEPIHFIPSPW
jgi:hypothetical protein